MSRLPRYRDSRWGDDSSETRARRSTRVLITLVSVVFLAALVIILAVA